MKAVRFSLASEGEEAEDNGGLNVGMDGEDGGYNGSTSRAGSKQNLATRPEGQTKTSKDKTLNPFMCGLCCRKAPTASVWNCDGEILPFPKIFCK